MHLMIQWDVQRMTKKLTNTGDGCDYDILATLALNEAVVNREHGVQDTSDVDIHDSATHLLGADVLGQDRCGNTCIGIDNIETTTSLISALHFCAHGVHISDIHFDDAALDEVLVAILLGFLCDASADLGETLFVTTSDVDMSSALTRVLVGKIFTNTTEKKNDQEVIRWMMSS